MTTDANDLEEMAKEYPNSCFLKGSGVLKLLGAIRTLEAEVAALKAQPAPAEAAQGEDSARLDAADLATIEEATKVLESAAKHNSLMGRTVFADVQRNRADRLRAIIDRARASAETGGVKP